MRINQEINKINYALINSWSKETSYELVKDNWSLKNKSLGQCAITSLIIQDYLGGDIVFAETIFDNSSVINHYWNFIDNIDYDLTIQQFTSNYKFINKKIVSRNTLLGNLDTLKRYQILKEKVDNYLLELNNIELLIQKCKLCDLEKINGYNIYFGSNTKILMIGEAPAKNGWRITGKAWINEQNKVIPSGKILEKLLINTSVNLFDISFIELIKCFPTDRKNLKNYASNCLYIFDKEIELLKPELIITLGEIPTKALLKELNFKKLSDVTGKEFKYRNSTIIPIFHPSPISPKSYNDNKPIFDNVISKYF